MRIEVLGIDNWGTVFLVYLCLCENSEMVPKLQVSAAWFSCSPPNLNVSKLIPFAVKANKLPFKMIQFDTNSKNQIPQPLSEATDTNNFNAFTSTLTFSEGLTDKAWKPSNKIMLFLSHKIKCLSYLP
jgi:hypothetical protein